MNIRLQANARRPTSLKVSWELVLLGPHPDRNAGRSSPHDVSVGTAEPQSASFLPEQPTDSAAAGCALAGATPPRLLQPVTRVSGHRRPVSGSGAFRPFRLTSVLKARRAGDKRTSARNVKILNSDSVSQPHDDNKSSALFPAHLLYR